MGSLRSRINGHGWHLVTGGFALTALAGVVSMAITWGGLVQRVEGHVDPESHALFVLAGDQRAAQRLTEVEAAQRTIADRVEELSSRVEDMRTDQSEAAAQRGKILGILEVLRDREGPREPRHPTE